MLKRAVQKILLQNNRLGQKTLVRAILTSKDSFYQQPLANNKEDIVVYSPFINLHYPNVSIDQFVWADIDKWINKTAIVRNMWHFCAIFFLKQK